MVTITTPESSVLPAWVSDYEQEYNLYLNGRKKWIRRASISGTSLIIIYFIRNFVTVSEEIFAVDSVIFIDLLLLISGVFFFYSTAKFSNFTFKPSQFLAGFLYILGYTINNNDDPRIINYIQKIDIYLKNVKSILDVVNNSIIRSHYVGTIESYLENLYEIIELCNEFAKHHDQYSIDKSDVSMQLMNLGITVRNDENKVSDKHTNLTQLLINDLKKDNLRGKAIQISIFSKIKNIGLEFINKAPEPIKLISLIIFILIFEIVIIYYFGTKLQISNETLFQTAILGSIASISVIFLICKNYLSKAKI